jgi:hypothetical protein
MKIKENRKTPSTTLGFVDLDLAKTAVLASLRSPGSRRCYEHAIAEFIDWYCSEPRLGFNKAVVTRYRMYLESRRLAPGTVNLRLAAIRRLAYEAADTGLLSPEQAAGIRRVKGAKKLGVRVGNWLRGEDRTIDLIPKDKREFASKPVQALRTKIFIEVKRNLAVRARAQTVSRLFKLALDCFIAVKLTVDHDSGPAVFTHDGLLASRKVDDTKARVSQRNASVLRQPVALAVWATMIQALGGSLQSCFRTRSPAREERDNSAHRFLLNCYLIPYLFESGVALTTCEPIEEALHVFLSNSIQRL